MKIKRLVLAHVDQILKDKIRVPYKKNACSRVFRLLSIKRCGVSYQQSEDPISSYFLNSLINISVHPYIHFGHAVFLTYVKLF